MRAEVRRLRKEARSVTKEARRILRRRRKRLLPAQSDLLIGAVREIEEAVLQEDVKAGKVALKKSHALLENNFAFARKSAAREWMESIAFAITLVLIVRTFIVQPFKIPTGSMEPTLLGVKKECPICHSVYRYDQKTCGRDGSRLKVTQTGDKILVNKFVYGAKTPDRIPFTPILLPYLSLPAIRKPSRGDIVVFHFPEDLSVDYVKRLMGLPGETLEINDGRILINGKPVLVPAMKKIYYTNGGPFGRHGQPLTIPSAGSTILLEPDARWYWEQIVRADGHTVKVENGRVLIDGNPREKYTAEQDYFYFLGDNSLSSQDSRYWGLVPEKYLVGEVFFIYWPPGRWSLVC